MIVEKLMFFIHPIEGFYIMSVLDHYKVFYYAVKFGSITRAAEELYITQPSASYAVKQLEEQLDVRLLVRKSKGVHPTEEGRVLFGYAEQAFKLLQSGETKIAEMKSYGAGVVRLGASDSLCKMYLLPFLESFREEHPGIRIRLSHGKSEDILKRLAEGAIDCGVVHLSGEQIEGVHITASRPIRDIFVAGPAFRSLAETAPIPLKRLVQEPFVLLSADSRSRASLRSLLYAHGLTLEPEIELGSVDLQIEFAAKNMGVTLVNADLVQAELDSGTLFELHTAEPMPERAIGVVTAAGDPLSVAASYFTSKLSERLSSLS